MWSLLEKILWPVWKAIEHVAKQRVDEIATSLAVRAAIIREQIRLRFEEYVHAHKLDSDRALGFQQRVCSELLRKLDLAKVDPEDENIRSEVAKAVTLMAVDLSVWVTLRELISKEPFNPCLFVTVEYRDSKGSTHHASRLIASIQEDFLFFQPFAFHDVGVGRVGPELKALIEERLKDEKIEITVCQVGAGIGVPFAAPGT